MLIDVHAHYSSPVFDKIMFKKAIENPDLIFNDGDERTQKWFRKIIKDLQKACEEETILHDLIHDMDEAGVDVSLLLSMHLDMNSSVIKACDTFSGKLYAVLYADPFNVNSSIRYLDYALNHSSKVIGIKTQLQFWEIKPNNHGLFPIYDYASRNKLPIQFHMGEKNMFSNVSDFNQLANLFPNLKIVCLHSGGVQWKEMADLAAVQPNIYLETEALQLPEVHSKLPDILRYQINKCGSRKIMFGSDWIWQEEKYFNRVKTIKELPEEDRKNIGERTPKEVYRI